MGVGVMRQAIVCDATSEDQAFLMCPWAAVVVEVEGGWMCFESVEDYRVWSMQV